LHFLDGFPSKLLLQFARNIQLHAWWVLLISKSTTQDFQITQMTPKLLGKLKEP
jgi:hypothetical protein